jgi:hypothetical protein
MPRRCDRRRLATQLHILSQIESGDPAAAAKLRPLVYDELRKVAAGEASADVGTDYHVFASTHEQTAYSQSSNAAAPRSACVIAAPDSPIVRPSPDSSPGEMRPTPRYGACWSMASARWSFQNYRRLSKRLPAVIRPMQKTFDVCCVSGSIRTRPPGASRCDDDATEPVSGHSAGAQPGEEFITNSIGMRLAHSRGRIWMGNRESAAMTQAISLSSALARGSRRG